jgi:hypothetical protein
VADINVPPPTFTPRRVFALILVGPVVALAVALGLAVTGHTPAAGDRPVVQYHNVPGVQFR